MKRSAKEIVGTPESKNQFEKELDKFVEEGKITSKEADEVVEHLDLIALKREKSLKDINKIYEEGYVYRKVGMPDGSIITKLFSTKGNKLVVKVEQRFKTYKNLSKAKKNDIVLVNGVISRKYFDDVIIHTNFPDKKLQNFIKENKINRFNSSLEDIKKIYKYYLREGHIKFDWHPLLEKRLVKHFDELREGIKYKNYEWMQTGGLPGIHAEILSVNEMLYRIEKVMNAKDLKMTDEIFTEMIGFNKRLNSGKVMIRCADCFYLTYGVTFIK